MPDDHSDFVPPLPIPNRTVKRICADDSAATSVKVGHRQAFIKKPSATYLAEGFCFARTLCKIANMHSKINTAPKLGENSRRRRHCNTENTVSDAQSFRYFP